MTGMLCEKSVLLNAGQTISVTYMSTTHGNRCNLTPISPFTQERQDERLGKYGVGHEH